MSRRNHLPLVKVEDVARKQGEKRLRAFIEAGERLLDAESLMSHEDVKLAGREGRRLIDLCQMLESVAENVVGYARQAWAEWNNE